MTPAIVFKYLLLQGRKLKRFHIFFFIDRVELWFTVAFVVDIAIRFLAYLPQPKDFFRSKKNMVDLFLAVTTLVIQIPPIHNSHAYVYLTVFQVLRIYRPIIYVERLRSLIVSCDRSIMIAADSVMVGIRY